MSCSRGKSTVISECCHSGWQLPFRGLSSPLTLPHIHRWVEDGPNKQSKRGNFRSARHGRTVFTLESIVFPMMVARFQTALSILTRTITYPTTTSIHKVRSPLHNHKQYLLPSSIQTAVASGSVGLLARVASLSVLLAVLMVLNLETASGVWVIRDFSGHSPLTISKPSMPFRKNS